MLEEKFTDVYSKFKLHFYQKIFSRFETRDSTLSAIETFSVEAINALGRPTTNEFAKFTNISPQNAAYKVSSLISKGYIKKVQSSVDRRYYHLEVTDKFQKYYDISSEYIHEVMERIRTRFSTGEIKLLEEMLTVMSEDLMPEIQLNRPEDQNEK